MSRPLEHRQVAPAGFLAAVKGGSALVGANELGFRLVPWLCALAGVVLIWRVSQRVLSGLPLLGVLLLFAVSPALTWYGGDVKPYSGDIAMTLLLALLALRLLERPDDFARAIQAGIVGAMAILLSYPAVPTAAVMGLILLVHWFRQRPHPRMAPLLLLGVAWAAAAALSAALALQQLDPEMRAFMERFWVDGFPPASGRGIDAVLWFPNQLFAAFGFFLLFIAAESPVGTAFVVACAAFALVGLLALSTRSPGQTALVLAPTAAAVFAAYARLLPFRDRVSLYAGWPLLVFTMAGLQWIHSRMPAKVRWGATGLGILIACAPAAFVLAVGRPPYHAQEARPVLTALAGRWRPGDELYVYYGARHAIEFYGRRSGFSAWTTGECHRGDPRAYFREVDGFRGHPRVWFFYTHAALGYREPVVIRSYFEKIGVEKDRIPDPFGSEGELEAAAYLYDLSDPVRLSAATAQDHSFPELRGRGPRILCDGTRVRDGS